MLYVVRGSLRRFVSSMLRCRTCCCLEQMMMMMPFPHGERLGRS